MTAAVVEKVKELTPEQVEEICTPIKIGPTWQKDPLTNKWVLPERTLGWQIAGWCADYLLGEDEQPWKFTLEQLRFILWWYAVDCNGRFIYRKGVLQRMKGWGKDPLLAVMCLVELCGPSRFSHWDDEGNPVGKSHPQAYVQVTAVNQSQTGNTMDLIPSLMSDRFRAEYDIKDGAVLIRADRGRKKLVAVTSSYRALEGKRTTFTLLNETHHWIKGNNGHKMYETIDGNATKKDSRYLAITNAYLPGEDSVGERMRMAWDGIQEGKSEDIGFLYDSLEAHPAAPLSGPLVPRIIEGIRGDAVWLIPEVIMQSIADTTLSPARSRRMWYNQITASEDALYGPADLIPLERDGVLQPGDRIVLGFDGGKSDDSSVLVALRIKDKLLVPLVAEEKPDGPEGDDWEVDRRKIDSEVHRAFREYSVVAFYADVKLWESYITAWADQYTEGLTIKAAEKNAIGWDMRNEKKATLAHEAFAQAIFDGAVFYNGDQLWRRHTLNVVRRENNYGVYFDKESPASPRKVDAYAASMLAYTAMTDFLTRKRKPERQHTRRGWLL